MSWLEAIVRRKSSTCCGFDVDVVLVHSYLGVRPCLISLSIIFLAILLEDYVYHILRLFTC